jgi:hypothetical protein
MACACEHGNERTGSIKAGKLLDYMDDYQLFLRGTLLHGFG